MRIYIFLLLNAHEDFFNFIILYLVLIEFVSEGLAFEYPLILLTPTEFNLNI